MRKIGKIIIHNRGPWWLGIRLCLDCSSVFEPNCLVNTVKEGLVWYKPWAPGQGVAGAGFLAWKHDQKY